MDDKERLRLARREIKVGIIISLVSLLLSIVAVIYAFS